uniref:hypothetical protein n=1 Tax=Candidatus Electronema sp. TaxID=2698783 RepID=UPI004056A0A2
MLPRRSKLKKKRTARQRQPNQRRFALSLHETYSSFFFMKDAGASGAVKEAAEICLLFAVQDYAACAAECDGCRCPVRSLLTFQQKTAIKCVRIFVLAAPFPVRFHAPLKYILPLSHNNFHTGEPPCPWIPPNTLTGKLPKPLKAT